MIPEFQILTRYADMLLLNWIISIVFYLLVDLLLNHKNKTSRIIQLALIPGVAIHELNHVIACKIFGIKVYGFDLSKGYITSENVSFKSPAINFVIAFAPLLFSLEIINVIQFVIVNIAISMPLQMILNYIVVSVTIAAGPSLKDTTNFIHSVVQNLKKFIQELLLFFSALFVYYVLYHYLIRITQIVTFHILIVVILMLMIRYTIRHIKNWLQTIKKKRYQQLLFLQNKSSRVNMVKPSRVQEIINKIENVVKTKEKQDIVKEREQDLKILRSEIVFDSDL